MSFDKLPALLFEFPLGTFQRLIFSSYHGRMHERVKQNEIQWEGIFWIKFCQKQSSEMDKNKK